MPAILLGAPRLPSLTPTTTLFAHLQMRTWRPGEVPGFAEGHTGGKLRHRNPRQVSLTPWPMQALANFRVLELWGCCSCSSSSLGILCSLHTTQGVCKGKLGTCETAGRLMAGHRIAPDTVALPSGASFQPMLRKGQPHLDSAKGVVGVCC